MHKILLSSGLCIALGSVVGFVDAAVASDDKNSHDVTEKRRKSCNEKGGALFPDSDCITEPLTPATPDMAR
ncbi:hypothetical protein OPV22_022415 [Ensete ventricosum]|uniref:Uncharacterized protein n=1 Tax=Ensete ventricosum TaxID=4639 RepID=A0AAV8QPU3_ENSVE|nr:hypothetical protein OPV22_022415 [Ensete ventricosum]